jgi:hypothetical protein
MMVRQYITTPMTETFWMFAPWEVLSNHPDVLA